MISLSLLFYLFFNVVASVILIWSASLLMIIQRKFILFLPFFIVGIGFCFNAAFLFNKIFGRDSVGIISNMEMSVLFVISILFIILAGQLLFGYFNKKILGRDTLYFMIILIIICAHIFLDVYSNLYGMSDFRLIPINFLITASIFPISLIFIIPLRHKINKPILYSYFLSLVICIIADLYRMSLNNGFLEIIHSISMLVLTLAFYLLVIKFLVDISEVKIEGNSRIRLKVNA